MKKTCIAVIALTLTAAITRAQSFTGSYIMHIENANKKSTTDMKISIDGDKSSMEMVTPEKAGKFRTIFDKKEQTMTILTEKDGGNKMAMIRKMPDMSDMKDKEGTDTKITVTDETKTVEGYKCKKVIAENEKMTNVMWVSDEVGLTYGNMFGMMHRGRGPSSGMATNMENYKDVKGVPLDMTITDKKKTDDVTHITMTDIKKGSVDKSVFDTSGYQVMDMRNMMGGGR